jgi:hypothetical protein
MGRARRTSGRRGRATSAAAAFAATIAAIAAGVLAAPAQAALDIAVNPPEARYGQFHHADGRLTDTTGAPVAGRRITLQKRDFPYNGPFRPIGHATTAADGTFGFDDIELERNADLRVMAFDGTTSGIARAWTYPAFKLTYSPAGTDRIRVTQIYTAPRDVRLTMPTLFYFGSASSTRSSRRVEVPTRRVAAGRYRATATIKLPSAWKGRFRYASCFEPFDRIGMGNPMRTCPPRFTF